jgi:hypothetical protein
MYNNRRVLQTETRSYASTNHFMVSNKPLYLVSASV